MKKISRIKKIRQEIKTLKRVVGPGVITGFSDDDSSGIGTYSAAGAKFNLGQSWLCLYQLPLMIAVQEMCGRLGMVTGKGLAGNMKKFFHRYWLYIAVGLLVFANTMNIGADISAMAESSKMILGGNLDLWAIGITLGIILLEVLVPYKAYAGILKWLTIPFFGYFIVAFMIPQDWFAIFKSVVLPHVEFNKDFLVVMVGFLGTTISPYLFFWQTSEEVEEEVKDGKILEMGQKVGKMEKGDLKRMRIDTFVGMIFSQVIALFIVVACAATLFKNGITDINSAQEAAQALRPLAGDNAYLLFAIGIIGAGLMGVPVLAGSAAYALSETFNWKEGLFHKFKDAIWFYAVIIFSTLMGLAINFIGINPMKALLYSAVVNGVVAVPLIAFITILANKKKVMGKYKNKPISNILGWVTFSVMLVASILMFYYW
ncbi:MAG TPA: divalent metal cation transporter [Patescibacteria group bacterium]|nr:divalent metal cation transporter [Patescibacteria group bacterium]